MMLTLAQGAEVVYSAQASVTLFIWPVLKVLWMLRETTTLALDSVICLSFP